MMTSIQRDIIDRANALSPVPFLRSRFGNDVKESRNGQHVSIKHVLRADYRNGKWIACDWQGSGIGDNINVVRHVTGCSFADAVETLVGNITNDLTTIPQPKIPVRRSARVNVVMRLPTFLEFSSLEANKGRNYLIQRGVNIETIRDAEEEGSLAYLENAVAFLGRSHSTGNILYCALRLLEDQYNEETGEYFNKRDLAFSQKKYPMVLSLPKIETVQTYDVFMVEGGINALAVKMLADKKGLNSFVFTTGSVGARVWMENDYIINTLKNANSITLIGENEKETSRDSAEKHQKDIDDIRQSIVKEVEIIVKKPVKIIYPPQGFEDMSDYLQKSSTDNKLLPENTISYPMQSFPHQ